MMRAADLQYGDFVGIAWALNDFIPSMIYCFWTYVVVHVHFIWSFILHRETFLPWQFLIGWFCYLTTMQLRHTKILYGIFWLEIWRKFWNVLHFYILLNVILIHSRQSYFKQNDVHLLFVMCKYFSVMIPRLFPRQSSKERYDVTSYCSFSIVQFLSGK